MYEVSSEIYRETDFQPKKSECESGKVVSIFRFIYPEEEELDKANPKKATADKDGDLIVCRKKEQRLGCFELEHSEATTLKLVGLQVWRGALLLADFFFHLRNEFRDANVLELGAGVGLTSIAAALFARQVICTDVDIGGILQLIRGNVQRNRNVSPRIGDVKVLEYDFMQEPNDYSAELKNAIYDSDIVVAADVIYDDVLTDAFVRVLDCIFKSEQRGKKKQVYVALEKRFVFTIDECDAVAPMFEYFLRQTMKKNWRFEYIPLDFPQYFEYERCKQLILLKLTRI